MRGRTFPAGRTTFNLVGGASSVECPHFCMGFVVLDSDGGQVPWHAHEQEEVYFILEGEGEMCVEEEISTVSAGDLVHIPSGAYHQLTNTGGRDMKMMYCFGPAGDVAHWRQELDGTLPLAGDAAPALPQGAWPQFGSDEYDARKEAEEEDLD